MEPSGRPNASPELLACPLNSLRGFPELTPILPVCRDARTSLVLPSWWVNKAGSRDGGLDVDLALWGKPCPVDTAGWGEDRWCPGKWGIMIVRAGLYFRTRTPGLGWAAGRAGQELRAQPGSLRAVVRTGTWRASCESLIIVSGLTCEL